MSKDARDIIVVRNNYPLVEPCRILSTVPKASKIKAFTSGTNTSL